MKVHESTRIFNINFNFLSFSFCIQFFTQIDLQTNIEKKLNLQFTFVSATGCGSDAIWKWEKSLIKKLFPSLFGVNYQSSSFARSKRGKEKNEERKEKREELHEKKIKLNFFILLISVVAIIER